MAISTLEEFQATLLENGDRGSAENLNASAIHIRSDVEDLDTRVGTLAVTVASHADDLAFHSEEVDDHHILLEILKGNPPAAYSPSTTYEIGEYVNHENSNWKAKAQVINVEPQVGSQSWELIELYASGTTGTVGDGSAAAILDIFRKDFIATEGQTDFLFDEASRITTISTFVDGILYDINEYNINADGIIFNEGLKANQRVVVLYNNALPVNSNLLTTSIYVEAEADQVQFNVKYHPGYEHVFLGGIKLKRDVDYTTNNDGNLITLIGDWAPPTGVAAGTIVEIVSFGVLVEDKSLFSNKYLESTTGSLDLSQADVFFVDVTADITITFDNVPVGQEIVSFTLEITGGGDYLVTFDENIIWDNGIAPALSTGEDVIGFYTNDSGTTWKGMLIGKDFR